MKLLMPKFVLARVRAFGGLAEQDLMAFIEAKMKGEHPRRLDKACGYDRFGRLICQLHVDLHLAHYRLTAHADPLLIYQQTPELLSLTGVATHEDIFHGNERRWCHLWQAAIVWDGCEHHRAALNGEFG